MERSQMRVPQCTPGAVEHRWLAWTSAPYWGARAQMWRWVHPRRRVVEAAQQPVKDMLKGNRQFVKDYQGARGTSGVSDDDFVYMSFTNAALGSTPYMILLDREAHTVVLSVRGTSSYADMITDLVDRPIDMVDWVPDDFKQEHGIEGPVKGHAGMFSAAKGVLQDLNSHQILPILLTGGPHSEEEQRRQQQLHKPDSREEKAPGGQAGHAKQDGGCGLQHLYLPSTATLACTCTPVLLHLLSEARA